MHNTHAICAAPQCDNPNHDGWLCISCRDVLRRDLKAVPTLCDDLQVTIAKQDRLGEQNGPSTDEHPLPLRLAPMQARDDLTDTLATWAKHVAAPRNVTAPHGPAPAIAAWLSMHLGDISDDPKAGDIADEIGYAVLVAQRAVDKPLQHKYAGPCDHCGADLYAHPKASEVTCRNEPCNARYQVSARRDWLLEQAEGQLLTATEMSRALPALLRHTLTAAMIRGLAHRGRLAKHPPHPERPREPLYRCGDVIELCNEIQRHDLAS